MNQTSQPTKEAIRQWLMERQRNRSQQPSMDQIKAELGWHAYSRSKELPMRPTPVTDTCSDPLKASDNGMASALKP